MTDQLAARGTTTSDAETESRREILDAAAQEFMKRGYSATSIVNIADRLGATKGRIYHWYRSKAEIYLDVHRRAMEILFEAVEPIAREAGPAAARLHRMVREHAAIMMRDHPYQRVSVQSIDMRALDGGSALEAVRRECIGFRDRYEQLFADVIAEGIAEGAVRQIRPRLATKYVFGALNWITMWYDPTREGSLETVDEIADEMAALTVDGLRRGVQER